MSITADQIIPGATFVLERQEKSSRRGLSIKTIAFVVEINEYVLLSRIFQYNNGWTRTLIPEKYAMSPLLDFLNRYNARPGKLNLGEL